MIYIWYVFDTKGENTGTFPSLSQVPPSILSQTDYFYTIVLEIFTSINKTLRFIEFNDIIDF